MGAFLAAFELATRFIHLRLGGPSRSSTSATRARLRLDGLLPARR